MQLNIQKLGMSHLYWETFSGMTPDLNVDSADPLQGLVSFVIIILPLACLWFPTIYLYVTLIQVKI